ncbi:hypothetical protein ACVJGD_000079 [Bradyrhizobium sp. USDA 10063]
MRPIDERGKSPISEFGANEGRGAEGSSTGRASGPGEEGRSFNSVVERIRSEPQDSDAAYSRVPPRGSAGRFAGPLAGPHRRLAAALQGAIGENRRRFRSLPESGVSRSEGEARRDDPEAESSRGRSLLSHPASGPEGGHVHDVPTQAVQGRGLQRPYRRDSGGPSRDGIVNLIDGRAEGGHSQRFEIRR